MSEHTNDYELSLYRMPVMLNIGGEDIKCHEIFIDDDSITSWIAKVIDNPDLPDMAQNLVDRYNAHEGLIQIIGDFVHLIDGKDIDTHDPDTQRHIDDLMDRAQQALAAAEGE